MGLGSQAVPSSSGGSALEYFEQGPPPNTASWALAAMRGMAAHHIPLPNNATAIPGSQFPWAQPSPHVTQWGGNGPASSQAVASSQPRTTPSLQVHPAGVPQALSLHLARRPSTSVALHQPTLRRGGKRSATTNSFKTDPRAKKLSIKVIVLLSPNTNKANERTRWAASKIGLNKVIVFWSNLSGVEVFNLVYGAFGQVIDFQAYSYE